jgi:hypothetical protein
VNLARVEALLCLPDAVAATELDAGERKQLLEAVARLPADVAALSRRMLDDWPRLTPAERVAGLLVLAEALAREAA